MEPITEVYSKQCLLTTNTPYFRTVVQLCNIAYVYVFVYTCAVQAVFRYQYLISCNLIDLSHTPNDQYVRTPVPLTTVMFMHKRDRLITFMKVATTAKSCN